MSLHEHEGGGYAAHAAPTSADGAMHEPTPVYLVGPRIVPCPAPGEPPHHEGRSGTSGSGLFDRVWQEIFSPPPQTGSGSAAAADLAQEPESTARAVNELHRLTGLTWQQLSELFQVARRSLHFWASGKPLNSRNEARLRRALAAVRMADRGAASLNRAMLLQDHDGLVPFDLLARERYEAFLDLVATGPGRRELEPARRSEQARAARRPPSPDRLVGAQQDRVHVEKGELLSSTPIRRSREK